MGDEIDRARLEGLSEKEQENKIFKRIEHRDVMKARLENELILRPKTHNGNVKVSTPKDQKMKEEQRRKKEERARVEAAAATAAMAAEKQIVKNILPSVPKVVAVKRKSDDAEEHLESEPEYFDPKERSKKRKKNLEMNKTDDKRSNAMAMLKAKREGKQKRGKFRRSYVNNYQYVMTLIKY